jgi:hypothetical protein
MPTGATTLTELRVTRTVLEVKCTMCERTGRAHIPALINEYGGSLSLAGLRRIFWIECPMRTGVTFTTCGVYLPGLSGNAGGTE